MNVALWLAGCIPQVTTEEGQLHAVAADVKILGSGQQPAPLLEGTVTCPALVCAANCPLSSDPLECFEVGSSGSVQLDDACWQFQGPGEAEIRFSPVPCAANDEGYVPVDDRLVFEIVSSDDLVARPSDLESAVESALSPGPMPSFPSDWKQPEGEPWQIMENQPFTFFPTLWRGEEEVGWTLAQGVGSASDYTGAPPLVTNAPGAVTVTLQEGAHAELEFRVGEASWPLAAVVGVADTAPVSLEVVVAYTADPVAGTSAPAGARAIVRDAEGKLVWGSNVVWSLDEGLLSLGDPAVALPGSDYVLILDQCVPPSLNGGEHTAILRATLGALTATAELQWTVPFGLSDEGFTPSAYCVGPGAEPPGDTGTPDTGTPPATDTGVPGDDTASAEPETPGREEKGCGCATGGDGRWLGSLMALLALRARRSRRAQVSVAHCSRRGEGGSLVSQCGGKVAS